MADPLSRRPDLVPVVCVTTRSASKSITITKPIAEQLPPPPPLPDNEGLEMFEPVDREAVDELFVPEGDLTLPDILITVEDIKEEIIAKYKTDTTLPTAEKLVEMKYNNQDGLWITPTSKVLVPDDKALRIKIITMFHDQPWAGHLGFEKSVELINRTLYWSSIAKDVETFVRTCESCQDKA